MKAVNSIIVVSLLVFAGCSQGAYIEPDSTPAISEVKNFEIIAPTQGLLTQGYMEGHEGFDIAAKNEGEHPDILAVQSGTVLEVSTETWAEGSGNFVLIDHGQGFVSKYAHCNEILVKAGDEVTQGQLIAKMGNTGRVYGPTGIHLHFELIQDGERVNPALYMNESIELQAI
jgi:murein DD-endopeptidase MepM/ murein hydrolase activator NlpD